MAFRDSNCSKGKPCSAACIQKVKVCRVEFPAAPQSFVSKARDSISAHSKELADHLGKGVAAWKAGKLLGAAISVYLENRYGIPRETSIKLAETAVQGIAATTLDVKNIRNVDQFSKKLLSEVAAAFVGKTAHAGAEGFLAAKEIESTLSTVLPVLAGKLSGIGTAVTTSKVPGPRELFNQLATRSKADIDKLRKLVNPTKLNFKEPTFPTDYLGDLTILALYLVHSSKKKN
jgi:hypothetical protein